MKFNRVRQKFWSTSSSGNHREGVGCPKPKTACPKRFKQQQKNNENLYKMCSVLHVKSRGLGTEITPNGPGYQAFHGCYIQKERMASKRWNLLDCSAFFYYVRTLIFFEWINLYLAKGLCQFSLVLLFAGKEKCACSSDKSCQKFTRPNQISTCPGQSDKSFVVPCLTLFLSLSLNSIIFHV